jgi:hypothetical protein
VHPLSRDSSPNASDSAFEKSPPWLVSTVLHLATLLCLAVFTIGVPAEEGLPLQLAPGLTVDSQDLDLGEAPAVEIVNSAEPLQAVVEEQPLELPTAELLKLDMGDLFASQGMGLAKGLFQGLGREVAGKGGAGSTSVFSLTGEGSRFVYVFDRSESMNSVFTLYRRHEIVHQETPLALAKAELLRSLERLHEEQQFQIVFYNHEPRLFGSGYYGDHRLYPASEENRRLAGEFVTAIPGEGNTNHWAALQASFPLKPDVVFLITDGEAKDDPSLHQVESMARFCLRRQIQVNVIHFSNQSRPHSTLIRLADETGGQHLFLDLRDLVAASR